MLKNQTSRRDGIQDILCPFENLLITQGTGINGGTYSHDGTRAIDTVHGDDTRAPYYAPFDLVCVDVVPSYGEATWQSREKVRFANGEIDYCTIETVHDDTFNAYVGMEVNQGEQLGNMGTKGNATGIHCHIEFSKGKNHLAKNKYGIYGLTNAVEMEDACFMDNTNIIVGIADWKYLKDVSCEKPYIKAQAHVKDLGWLEPVGENEICGTKGESRRLEAIKIDSNLEIYAKAHLREIGDVDYGKIDKNTIIGTEGESRRIEALCLKGNFEYRVHMKEHGDSEWHKADGETWLGTKGESRRLEAIEFRLI